MKTILVNKSDTIKLSKQFGIIQFPKLYNHNKYYRLVGIEDASQYDPILLFGERVPNAWDLYNFEIKKKFCRNTDKADNNGSLIVFTCIKNIDIIQNKTVTAAGYPYGVYRVNKTSTSSINQNFCSSNFVPATTLNVIENFSSLQSKSATENRMYPGMVGSNHPGYSAVNVTRYGLC
ncbi:MAG: hypothetical protein SGJ15_04820 [Bacteroidota bacterium]|nr:hypothetical protein [Bacteroidota bacterium]